MFRNVFLSFSLPFLLNCLPSGSTGYWISDLRNARQLQAADDVVVKEENSTSFGQDLFENSTTGLSGDESLFWTVSDANETTEGGVTVQMDHQEIVPEETNDGEIEAVKDTEKEEAAIQVLNQGSVYAEANPTEAAEMDQKIVLERANCHLEIAIQSTYDLKMQIMFGRLQNNTSGKCCITLNGPENSLLAIFITNIHLYQNGSDGEVLKVITSNHGSPYVLKEYYHQNTYQPLLLTETHKIYLVLHYKVTTVSPNETASHFNLEVLTYHKNENYAPAKIPKYFPAQNSDKFYAYK